jgi:hypothetical protein
MATRKSIEKTSPAVATKASRVLASPAATPAQKSAAGSALRQSAGGVTSPGVAKKAAKLLDAPKTPIVVKTIAGSVLTQTPNKKARR